MKTRLDESLKMQNATEVRDFFLKFRELRCEINSELVRNYAQCQAYGCYGLPDVKRAIQPNLRPTADTTSR